MAGSAESDRPDVELFVPALTNVSWSTEIVGQTLEALFVCLRPDGAHRLRPIHAPALRLGWRPDLEPADVILGAVRRYGLRPLLLHSTSWRFEGARVFLTYVAAVAPPDELDQYLVDEPVRRSDLARGDAMGGTPEIGLAQVVEHAFRHLSWLVKDDAAVREALSDWVGFLEAYEPEPFRAFGPGLPT